LLGSALFLTVLGVLNLSCLAQGRERGARGVFASVHDSRAMLPLGVLFGLNLDTAAEILLLAGSAAALHALAPGDWATLALPLSFTAGMALADSGEGLLMVRLYDWAVGDADRSLRLNTVTTALSALLALTVALGQWAALARSEGIFPTLPAIDIDGPVLGAGMTALMAALWLLARWRRRAVAAATPLGVTSD